MPSPAAVASAIAPRGFALWNLGFRPFYLLAAIFAAVAVPLWIAQYAGLFGSPSYLAGPMWHVHEMVFGYTAAVIAGFLMTAVRNWTSRPTPVGAALAGLALLWVAARAASLTPYGFAAALLSVAFPLVVAAALAVPIVRSANRHNYVFIVVLVTAGARRPVLPARVSRHGRRGSAPRDARRARPDPLRHDGDQRSRRAHVHQQRHSRRGGAANALGRRRGARRACWRSSSPISLQAPPVVVGVVAAVAAIAHAARLCLWRPWTTFGVPLVWILHVACGWIAVHLLLRALAAAGMVAEPLATHALTLGGIGGLTLGMMTRTARGHTGRPLQADGFELAMFVLVQLRGRGAGRRSAAVARRLHGRCRRRGGFLVGGVCALCDPLLADPDAAAHRRQAGLKRDGGASRGDGESR